MDNKYNLDWFFTNIFIRIILPIILTGLMVWMTNINLKLHNLEINLIQIQTKAEATESTLQDINDRVISIDNYLRNGK